MAPNPDTEHARQSEGSTNTFWILIVSTAVAAAIAIAGYVYVFSTPNTALRDQGGDVVAPQSAEGEEGGASAEASASEGDAASPE